MSHVPCPFRLVDIKRSGIRRLAFALNSGDACNAPLPPSYSTTRLPRTSWSTSKQGFSLPRRLVWHLVPTSLDLFSAHCALLSIAGHCSSLLGTAHHHFGANKLVAASSFSHHTVAQPLAKYLRKRVADLPTYAYSNKFPAKERETIKSTTQCLRFGKRLLSCSRKCPYPPF
ncbi:hypothetical protein BGZ61DRAFT_48721 [Ilyonectria robusta]|uniref:uncharacterized protein n=1 Tax=Ilyonectria robusta TaxID=1079257 RepID=UPI001E8D4736|nr:uncharacterized protein BGZ61DRAFT_48721 [Ilyonectria robusta]KAH8686954.1 hypothetical protein BGZ61DRAFT_48721 [Ilyonectria robusta]